MILGILWLYHFEIIVNEFEKNELIYKVKSSSRRQTRTYGRIENFSFYNDAMSWEKSVLFVAMHAIYLGLLSIERRIC